MWSKSYLKEKSTLKTEMCVVAVLFQGSIPVLPYPGASHMDSVYSNVY